MSKNKKPWYRRANPWKSLRNLVWDKTQAFYRSIGRTISDFGWWFQYRLNPKHRYHIINISGLDGYTYGWLDRDHALLLAAFKILTEYVELERFGNNPVIRGGWATYGKQTWEEWAKDMGMEDDGFKHQWEADNEIRALYDWWTVDRAKEHVQASALWDNAIEASGVEFTKNGIKGIKYAEARIAHDREAELRQKDTDTIVRLAKIRDYLWT